MLEKGAIAATDIEDMGLFRDHRRNRREVGSQTISPCAHEIPRCDATAFRKPRTVANISGSSSRKESWPRSVLISTKLTFAAAAFSAWATRLFSTVGNSQSLVNEMMQKRVLVPRKASASTPP